jgi:hypothetical protein
MSGRSWRLKEGMDAILPDKWFRSLADGKISQGMDRLRNQATHEINVGKTRSNGPKRPDTFGLGSASSEVRLVQGKPDQVNGETWRYGGSEVYFAHDRVIGWRVGDGVALKVR